MKHSTSTKETFAGEATPASVTSQSIAEVVDLLQGHSVLVIGDVMLDEYQTGTVERISPEAPVPVVRIESERYTLGGAANVARNIRALGGRPVLVGLSGEDRAGRRLQGILDQEEIEHHLIRSSARNTTVKTRILAQGQQIVRIDRETTGEIEPTAAASLMQRARQLHSDAVVTVVSDYGKGVVTKKLLDSLRQASDSTRSRILVDPKVKNFKLYRDVFCLTPNAKEAGDAAGLRITGKEDIIAAGTRILEQTRSQNVLVTLGSEGMALFQSGKGIWHIPTAARNVYDVTGAGDTVIAVLSLALSAGVGMLNGCIIANFAAGLVVGKVGTAVVKQDELKSSILGQSLSSIEGWEG